MPNQPVECSTCGCVVTNFSVHLKWHEDCEKIWEILQDVVDLESAREKFATQAIKLLVGTDGT